MSTTDSIYRLGQHRVEEPGEVETLTICGPYLLLQRPSRGCRMLPEPLWNDRTRFTTTTTSTTTIAMQSTMKGSATLLAETYSAVRDDMQEVTSCF